MSDIGRPTGGKAINLSQLEAELNAAHVPTPRHIGLQGDFVVQYSPNGQPSDFPPGQQARADQVIAEHVAQRDRSHAEYQAEYTDPATSLERRVEIQAALLGLLPREQVT